MEHPPSFSRSIAMLSGKTLFAALAAAALLFLPGGCARKETKPPTYLNSIDVKFILIPAGSFTMGCDPGKASLKCGPGETPAHKVTITKSFYLGQYEVTQGQWAALMNNDPNYRHHVYGENNPIFHISWDQAQLFIEKLNAKEPGIVIDGKRHRYALPTEAQWEYAERAGSRTEWFCGADSSCLDPYVYFWKQHAPHSAQAQYPDMRPVGQKSSNAWGLYDMQGNFSEWVADPPRQYERGHEYDPRGRTTESSVAVKVLWLDARSSMAKEPTRGVRGGPAFDWMTGLKALSDPETETGNRFRFASARRFRAHKESITGMSFRLALVEE